MGVFAGVRREGNPDPAAGVSLVRLERCPLCHDCATTIAPHERAAWAA